MFKNLLVVFVFLYQFRGYAFRHTQEDTSKEHILEGDTTLILPISQNVSAKNSSEVAETINKTSVVINMHGHNIFYISPQIFSDELQVKRLVSDVTCELQNTSVTAITNNNNVTKEIPQDYFVTPGVGAHKLHFKNMTWNKARLTCMKEGGHLAIVNSEAENNVFLQKLVENNLSHAWLGLHDLFEEGYWVTVNGETLESLGYTKWANPWEPNNYQGKQHCATFAHYTNNNSDGMDDDDCTKWIYFFCEIPI